MFLFAVISLQNVAGSAEKCLVIYIYNITLYNSTYRVIQEESAILWEKIVCVILSKKFRMNMGPILNGYRNYGKKKIRTISAIT
jgi:hypothetical protein